MSIVNATRARAHGDPGHRVSPSQPNALRETVRIVAPIVLLICSLRSPDLQGQPSRRVAVDPGSLARVLTGVVPATRAAANAFVTGPDSVARSALGVLRADPAALPFVLMVLPKEPSPVMRRSLIGIIQASENHVGLDVRQALRDVVSSERDSAVLMSAINALRVIALRETQLTATLARRIAGARSAGDTALLPLLLEADESFAHLERAIHAPIFARTPPPPFTVEAQVGASFRVLAFGDYGTAHLRAARAHQTELAAVMRGYHAANPFAFGITTGDNFYPTSFPSPTDPGWKLSWNDQYAALGIPIYISLGNHDWAEPAGPMAEHVYAITSKSWRFPAFYYTYSAGPAQFFALNTNALTERQLTWLRAELTRSTARWKVVYGHFPVFEQTDYTVERQQQLLLPILKQYKVDMYLAGHHHSIQHWQMDGIDYVVTGAGGAATYALGDTTKANPARRFVASRPAFADLQVSEETLTLRFVGIDSTADGAAKTQTGRAVGKPVVLYQYIRR